MDSMTHASRRASPIRTLVEHHQEALWLWLRTIGAGGHLAEDIAQEAFLILLRKPWHDWSNAQIAGFLRATGRNLLMARNAKQRRRTELLAQHAEELWGRLLPDEQPAELRGKLMACVDALPKREQSIIREHYLEETPLAELVTKHATTSQALYGLLHRARQRLRACIEGKME